MTATTTDRCGTPAEYQRHVRAGEKPCPACAAAHRQYQAAHRAASPAHRRYDTLQLRAYRQAERRLRTAHRAEFDRYYTQERRAVGLQR